MLNGRRRWLALGALAGVLIVGAGAALAASGSADNGFLAGVASRLGISEDKLKDAITDETIARIDAAVRRGDLTEEQGERLKERARAGEGLGRLGLGPGLGVDPLPFPRLDFGRGFGHAFKAVGDQIEAAADYLGLTRAQLVEELSDGDSLADVARQKGKSVDGLKTAMRNALKADLDRAVEKGAITREHADEMLDELSDVLDDAVEGNVRGFGFRMRFRWPGGDMDFGFGRDAKLPGVLPVPDPLEVEAERLQTF